jgi:hypothetical protein
MSRGGVNRSMRLEKFLIGVVCRAMEMFCRFDFCFVSCMKMCHCTHLALCNIAYIPQVVV